MTYRFLLIHPDPESPPEWIEGDDGYTLLKGAVDGWIEYLPTQRVPFELVCNEEYALVNDPVLNTFATILWSSDPLGEACVEAHPLGGVCGPVVVVGRTTPDGDTQSLPESVGQFIIEAFGRWTESKNRTNTNTITITEDPQ